MRGMSWVNLENRRPHTVWLHLYEMCRTGQSTESASRSVAARALRKSGGGGGGWLGMTANGHRGDKNILKLD